MSLGHTGRGLDKKKYLLRKGKKGLRVFLL
jgi:hypothetical protein